MASELELLTSNRQELVDKIRDVKPFLDRLLEHGEIVREEYDSIVAEKTPQDRARALLDVVSTKGLGAFHHFRKHLKKVNSELEEVLHRCPKHNQRLKLYCEDCETLLCSDCRSEDHNGHRCSSLVADADVIRREFTAFKRENRKLLMERAKGPDGCDTETMRRQASDRTSALKKAFCARADEEYHWFLGKLGDGCVRLSPAISVSSIADSESVSGHESETIEIIDPDEVIFNPFSGEDKEANVTECHTLLYNDFKHLVEGKSEAVHSSTTTMRPIRVPLYPFRRLPTVEWLYSVGIGNFEKNFKPLHEIVPGKQLWNRETLGVEAESAWRNRKRSEPARRSSGNF